MATGQSRWHELLRSPAGVAGIACAFILVATAILGPIIFHDAASRFDVDAALQGPSPQHLLGTDELGRDTLARVVAATGLSLGVSAVATLLGAFGGIALGVLPTISGPRVARLIAALINFALAFPALLLTLFVAAIVGAGLTSALFAIAIALTPVYARLTQTLAAGVKNADYIAAARLLGASRAAIVRRHLVPNILGPLLVTAIMTVSSALVVLSSLSFLGLGVQVPQYDWGVLLTQGLNRIYVDPAPALAPAAAIVLAGLALSFIGEALAILLDLRPLTRWRSFKFWAAKPIVHSASAPSMTHAPTPTTEDLLEIAALNVDVATPSGDQVRIVHGLSLKLAHRERVGIVGESGSGKTMATLAIAQLLDGRASASAAQLKFLGQPMLGANAIEFGERNALLGASLAVVFQDPLASFNPLLRVGSQLADLATTHGGMTRSAAIARATNRLALVGIDAPERRTRQYPHELSGGMLQRSMIGMGLMLQPRLIIADEPTTSLDMTVQKQVLALLERVCDETGAGLLLISHDFAVVTRTCQRILVMYAGCIVEDLSVEQLLAGPAHPYTRALLASTLHMDADRSQPLVGLAGRAPLPGEVVAGCAFAARCRSATERCSVDEPTLTPLHEQHRVACWHPCSAENPA